MCRKRANGSACREPETDPETSSARSALSDPHVLQARSWRPLQPQRRRGKAYVVTVSVTAAAPSAVPGRSSREGGRRTTRTAHDGDGGHLEAGGKRRPADRVGVR